MSYDHSSVPDGAKQNAHRSLVHTSRRSQAHAVSISDSQVASLSTNVRAERAEPCDIDQTVNDLNGTSPVGTVLCVTTRNCSAMQTTWTETNGLSLAGSSSLSSGTSPMSSAANTGTRSTNRNCESIHEHSGPVVH
eukprot:TRINITY_DN19801_c0_g1_i1.p1 TRINITY_DN19801_c0_g1~~TRINITY_DN19801_c0_g1_i1.p1  ORF type:complete len:136 (-),score=3.27 TRINITY_DN19801_c0_g1_i1:29-436(-)